MKNKNLLIAGGVALGLSVLYFFWKRTKDDSKKIKADDEPTEEIDEWVDEDADVLPELPTTQPSQPSINLVPIGRVPLEFSRPKEPNIFEGCEEVYKVDRITLKSTRKRDSFNYVWVYLMNRPNQINSGIRKNSMIGLINAGVLNGRRRVNDVFIDSNGRIGAISIQVSKSIYTPTSNDTSLRNKAEITFGCASQSSFDGNRGDKFECSELLNDI